MAMTVRPRPSALTLLSTAALLGVTAGAGLVDDPVRQVLTAPPEEPGRRARPLLGETGAGVKRAKSRAKNKAAKKARRRGR